MSKNRERLDGETERLYAVDRLEGTVAVLVGDDGSSHDVPRRELPGGVREGTVLRVPLGAGGTPDWSGARIDERERRRRLAESRELLDNLGATDPGGDIRL